MRDSRCARPNYRYESVKQEHTPRHMLWMVVGKNVGEQACQSHRRQLTDVVRSRVSPPQCAEMIAGQRDRVQPRRVSAPPGR
jgi:hypothetical protein